MPPGALQKRRGSNTSTKFIVITGTPGTGKTTLAKLLSKITKYPIIELSKISVEKNLVNKFDEKRNTWILNLKKTQSYLLNQTLNMTVHNIILDGHLTHLVSPRQKTELVVILRCSPEKLEKRLTNRGYADHKIEENVLSEFLDIILIEVLERYPSRLICEIDTTHIKPAESVYKIISILEGKHDKSFGRIDWIDKMVKNNKMDKFLKRLL